ncbi:hypothetical protein LTR37_001302 [Vermiconidia calcicola]|uniref:Uncharacterized protein n=1 Tax=Vermiconidia calcicola TaxID=1690605 RepID=A0ACC3NXW2_9PEZI|nr:hypothetical protein LTR37_001302 [Vermiconidia calcicola]
MAQNKTASEPPRFPSKNEIYQSYGGWNNFMRSYGLKAHEPDHVEGGNAIAEGMRQGEYEGRVDAAEAQAKDQGIGGQRKGKQ